MPVKLRSRGPERGITLIELMVTIALLALLLGLAAPAFNQWISNSRVRAVTDGLQSGTRLAQSEALRLNRQVVFFLTNEAGCAPSMATAAANGRSWAVRTVPLPGSDDIAQTLQCGQIAELAPNVAVTGPTAICFSSLGRLMSNPNPGIGGFGCAVNDAAYNVSATGADRSLRVTVALGGQVRLCDPNRTLSDTTPDGCP